MKKNLISGQYCNHNLRCELQSWHRVFKAAAYVASVVFTYLRRWCQTYDVVTFLTLAPRVSIKNQLNHLIDASSVVWRKKFAIAIDHLVTISNKNESSVVDEQPFVNIIFSRIGFNQVSFVPRWWRSNEADYETIFFECWWRRSRFFSSSLEFHLKSFPTRLITNQSIFSSNWYKWLGFASLGTICTGCSALGACLFWNRLVCCVVVVNC